MEFGGENVFNDTTTGNPGSTETSKSPKPSGGGATMKDFLGNLEPTPEVLENMGTMGAMDPPALDEGADATFQASCAPIQFTPTDNGDMLIGKFF